MDKLLSALLISSAFMLSLSAVEKPNIVFLLADDMSRDTWGVYGSKDCKTPNIDRLAKDGLPFNKVYCSVATCAPFRRELYSGRSSWRIGTLANHSKSSADTKSIPYYLRPLGYRVALTGKTPSGPAQAYPFEILKGQDFVGAANKFFDECIKEKKPFCLFIASHDGHAPFTTGDVSQYDKDKLMIPPYWLDTPQLRKALVKYYAEITTFDKLLGNARDILEKKGLWKSTLFVVCRLSFAVSRAFSCHLPSGRVITMVSMPDW
ncbi:MAG: sulfatase-like hydrolase/transferase [Lentisphaeraceae bacterium]|nr:sulfatase-like hydrolase/transferase [Lentisphaeraceae bacterium]